MPKAKPEYEPLEKKSPQEDEKILDLPSDVARVLPRLVAQGTKKIENVTALPETDDHNNEEQHVQDDLPHDA